MIAFFMKRGDRLFREKYYDEAVEELENVFVLDPLNRAASGGIDAIKKRFLREKKKEWKGLADGSREELADRMGVSFETVEGLIREGNLIEAKIMLNRMAYVDPADKRIQALMAMVQREEKRSGGKGAA